MKVVAAVKIDLSGMVNYQREIDQIREKVYRQWSVRYRSFVQRRFNIFSRGGGDWPALKYRQGSILRDTNTLFNTMGPQIQAPPGSVNRIIEDGIEVGYAGTASHPAGPTIAQIAWWHHHGMGNNPVRQIIVQPDSSTVQSMVQDMQRALDKNG